jgi:hypothetical protein
MKKAATCRPLGPHRRAVVVVREYLGKTRIPHLIEALHSGLRKLGYVEGKNLKVEYRW